MCLACATLTLSSADAATFHAAEGMQATTASGAGWTYAGSSGQPNVDSILIGTRWDTDVLTWGVPDTQAEWGTGYPSEPNAGPFVTPTDFFRGAAELVITGTTTVAGVPQRVLTSLAEIIPITFLRAEDPGQADLRGGIVESAEYGGIASPPGNILAGTLFGSGGKDGDFWINYTGVGLPRPDAMLPGSFAWSTMIHELGHAMGLAHSFDGPWYGYIDQVTIEGALNGIEHTMMAYNSTPARPNTIAEAWSNPQTLMRYDIAALQHLYGANFATRGGNTTYAFRPDSSVVLVDGLAYGGAGENRILLTLWDGGGTDTYDASAYVNGVSIDLRPGEGSVLSPDQLGIMSPAGVDAQGNPLDAVMAEANVWNAFLYQGDLRSLIENALGGSGDDRLRGNQAANRLEGSDGTDTLIGEAGNDSLLGGTGADSLIGGAGNDSYWVDSREDKILEETGGGRDRVLTNLSWKLGVELEDLTLLDRARKGLGNGLGNQLQGNDRANLLSGGAGNDLLLGLAGNDLLRGGTGNDVLDGGDGRDQLYGGTGNEVMVGDAGADMLWGEDGEDALNGGAGADTLWGGADDDRILGGTERDLLMGEEGDDSLEGGSGDDWLDGGRGADTLSGQDGDDAVFGGDGNDLLRGNEGRDALSGGSGADTLAGDEDHDALLGGAGRDLLGGGKGNDTLLGGTGRDHLAGEAGADSLSGGAGNDLLQGGAGRDTLDGGAGLDTLVGGAGADSFLFDFLTDAQARLQDFQADEDLLILIGLGPLVDEMAELLALVSFQGDDLLISGSGLAGTLVIAGLDTETLESSHIVFRDTVIA